MIQHTDRTPPVASRPGASTTATEGPEIWGQQWGRRHYSLEVVQSPSRARMCGFGDKDRRPLAPAAVAKMVVRREDDTIVDVDDVDISFFLVTVDLWSADGKQEMNLVLHPSTTSERAAPPITLNTKTLRRRNTSASQRSGNHTPAGATTPTPSQPSQDTTNPYPSNASPPAPPQTWGYPPQAPVDRTTTYGPPILPSISNLGRSSASASESWSNGSSQDSGAYGVDPSLRSTSDSRENSGGWGSVSQHNDQSNNYGPGPYPPPYHNVGPFTQDSAGTPPPNVPRQPANYTRTLVGPLSANACRLLDEHRKEGIFFLFQDLSVRTEGTFRLRMRLMNVGANPAPEAGGSRVHNEVSPVLAQTFTEPFTVYSAKRFPGVPDTTALSIAFGNQGQKLPLRNRHGTSKRRRRGGSDSDDSDDA